MKSDEAMRDVRTLAHSDVSVNTTGVDYDSRRIESGNIFVAMQGETTDGNRFITDAIRRGARVIVTDSRAVWQTAATDFPEAVFYLVDKGRRALAEISANVFGHPERKLALSAVTGTNGKTTTSYLLESMLKSAGRICVLVGTIETHVGREIRASPHTTPESRDLLEVFADGVNVGATEAVIEISSHALEQERVWGLPVDVAMFTNLTQDHLDYHETMENYFAAKARLFQGVGTAAPRVAIINMDDAYGDQFAQMARRSQVVSYGLGQRGDFRAEQVKMGGGETRFKMVTPGASVEMQSPLMGRVNVYNLLAASAAAYARGLTLEQIVAGAVAGAQVPGRFQVVPSTNDVTVIVDYAHTDDALRNLIELGREFVKDRNGRVITLFGCGGDRDRTKRPRMGRVAGQGSDQVVLTSDNPRGEEPMAIIAEVLKGLKETGVKCLVEVDRASAIELAIREAHPGDIVLLAGKGHEKVQILKDRTVLFDDAAVAAKVLKELAQ
jgi:UDP-N-acetylmuramoyl-L-alanyl-D-glutamate--2,6-diaminopimelate ligase